VRKASQLVFDEYVSGPGQRHYTSDRYSDGLGQFDQLALQVLVDDIDVTGKLDLVVQHSADGVHFVDKGALPIVSGALLERGRSMTITAADAGTTPSLTYVRFCVVLGVTSSAHVRIYVTMRDEGVADVVMAPRGPGHAHPPKA
jgi:hypothetical protein